MFAVILENQLQSIPAASAMASPADVAEGTIRSQ